MTPDELGEKGESKFKELCADAGLICNKSDRDKQAGILSWIFLKMKNQRNLMTAA